MSLNDLHTFFRGVRSRATKDICKHINRRVSALGSRIVDLCDMGRIDLALDLLGKKNEAAIRAYSSRLFVMEKIREAEKSPYKEDYDFQCDVEIFPLKDKILCMIFSGSNEITKIWERASKAKKYGYWNNVDKPSSLSVRDWEKRRKEWDEALSQFGSIPSLNGFGVKLFLTSEWIVSWKSTDLQRYAPSFENRKNAVKSTLMIEHENIIVNKLAASKGIKIDHYNIYGLMREASKSEEYKQESERLNTVVSGIKKKLVKEDFLREYMLENNNV